MKHQAITDGLHLFASMLGQHVPRPSLELERHRERPAVTFELGEGGEPDEVREQKGVARLRHSDTDRYAIRY